MGPDAHLSAPPFVREPSGHQREPALCGVGTVAAGPPGEAGWAGQSSEETILFIFFYLLRCLLCSMTGASQVLLVVKNPPASAGDIRDTGSIPGLGRSPGGGRHGKALQSSCLENPMDRGAWRAAVHGVENESDTTEQQHVCMHAQEGTLAVWPGIEFLPPAVEVSSPNHWTTREFL